MDELVDVTRNAQQVFAAQDDVDKVALVHEALAAADGARGAELERQREILRALGRQYETQKAAATRPPTAPTPAQHRDALARLDDDKLQLGKRVTAIESDVAGREARLATARAARADEDRTADEADAVIDADLCMPSST